MGRCLDRLGAFFKSLARRKTLVASILLAVVLAGAIPLVRHYWSGSVSSDPTGSGISLVAEKEDGSGIDTRSRFLLTVNRGMDFESIRRSLTVSPLAHFTLEKKDSRTVSVAFSKPLKGNTVYVFRLSKNAVPDGKAHAGDDTESYSWAFQTKEVFQVETTTPADHSTDVPLSAGIEMTLSHDGAEDIGEYFSIEPQTRGKFERNQKTIVFVPERLLARTVYTVTLKKGFGSTGRLDRLEEDMVFRFETADDRIDAHRQRTLEINANSYFEGSVQEFDTRTAPVFSVARNENEPNLNDISVEVYRFADFEDFYTMLQTRDEYSEKSGWSLYSNRFRYDTGTLSKVAGFSAPVRRFGWKDVLVFPEPLGAGWYVFEASVDGGDEPALLQQVAFQVTDLSAYAVSSTQKGLLWINDASEGSAVSGATAQVLSSDGKKKTIDAKSDKDGILDFDNDEIASSEMSSDGESKERHYIKVTDDRLRSILIPSVAKNQPLPAGDRYWAYLYVDRTQYQPTDTVKFWGIVRDRSKEKPGKMRLRVQVNGGERYESEIETNENGTVVGEIPMRNWEAGQGYDGYAYRLSLGLSEGEDEGEEIVERYFYAMEYAKKAYRIDVAVGQRAYFAQSDATFNGVVRYFDGTPVPNREIKCESGESIINVVSDADGKFVCRLGVGTTYNSSIGQKTMTVGPTGAEVSDIYADATFDIIPGSSAVQAKYKVENGKIRLFVESFEFDMPKYLAEKEYDYSDHPSGGKKVKVTVTEVYYEKIEKGERYDFMEKRSVKEYEYERKTRQIGEYDIATGDDGKSDVPAPLELGKQYEVRAETTDGEGRIWRSDVFVYGGYREDIDNGDNVSLERREGMYDREYALKEDVKLVLTRQGAEIRPEAGKRALFFRAQGGILERKVSDAPSYEFAFSEREIPNVSVTGVWWDGKVLRSAENTVFFDSETRELGMEVRSDKAEYRPGEQAKLDVFLRDASGRAKSGAIVNVNVVDEAAGGTAPPQLNDLYSYKSDGLSQAYMSHAYPQGAMAEQGGCFVAGTPVRLSDGSNVPIESIRVGDEIRTRRDIFSSEQVASRVTDVIRHSVEGYLLLNQRIGVTPEHILWVNGTWKTAGDLRVGDTLLLEDERLETVRDIMLVRRRTEVFNLTVEGTHTYFASGAYVHNCKGGDCGRMLFPDHIFFGETVTDDTGRASVSVKLPDSVTSWDVRAQAVTDDLFFADGQRFLNVTLPFFVDFDVASQYLAADRPVLNIRGFGKALDTGADIRFTVSAPSLGIPEKELTAKAFETVSWEIPTLSEGEHLLTVAARSGGLEDRITRKISVVGSRSSRLKAWNAPLVAGTKVQGSDDAPTRMVVSDEATSLLLRTAQTLANQESLRMDAVVARIEAQKILKERFGAYLETDEAYSRATYQKEDGGYAVLPYGGSELTASYLLAILGKDEYFSRHDISKYFESIVGDEGVTAERRAMALAGLGALRKPVLLDLRGRIDRDDIGVREKLILATGLAAIGDESGAKKVAVEILREKEIEKSPDGVWSVESRQAKTLDDTLSDTALAAGFFAIAGLRDEAVGFARFLEANTSERIPFFLDKLVVVDRMSKTLGRDGGGTFEYELGGKGKKETLAAGATFEKHLSPQERDDISFKAADSGLRVTTFYRTGTESAESDAPIKLKRKYLVSGKETKSLREKEVVRVRIEYDFLPDASDGCYQVTDYLPSGLRFVDTRFHDGEQLGVKVPEKQSGNSVSFCAYKNDSEPFVEYFARVSGKGDFLAEGVVAQSVTQISRWSRTEPERLEIR